MGGSQKNYPTKFALIARIAVSAYLLYTVWSLRGAPAEHTGAERVFFIAAMIIFLVAAVVLGGFSLRAFLRGEYMQPGEDEREEQPNHIEEEDKPR